MPWRGPNTLLWLLPLLQRLLLLLPLLLPIRPLLLLLLLLLLVELFGSLLAIALTNIVLVSVFKFPCLSVWPLASCRCLSDLLLFPLPCYLLPLGRKWQRSRMLQGARNAVQGSENITANATCTVITTTTTTTTTNSTTTTAGRIVWFFAGNSFDQYCLSFSLQISMSVCLTSCLL